MKIKQIVAVAIAVFLGISLAQAATAKLNVKAGDTAYVCQCGEKPCCETAALKPAKCGCGHEMGKVAVTKVKGSKAYYEAGGKEKAFKITGKYACGCGGDCCAMVSQKPGKCSCGKEMTKGGKTA